MKNVSTKILLTGATGFIGSRLLRELSSRHVDVRCLVRSADRFPSALPQEMKSHVIEGDLLMPETLPRAVEGIDTVYYLVHSMGGRSMFQYKTYVSKDTQAVNNFTKAAEDAGVERVIYLGGLGEMGDNLSEHLRSRQIVAQVLQASRLKTTVLRAANIIGAGGAPF